MDVDTRVKPLSSVSVCFFIQNKTNPRGMIFEKCEKGFWFKGGYKKKSAQDAYLSGDFWVYPSGEHDEGKNAHGSVFPCGASKGKDMTGESIKEAGFREFQEETGFDLQTLEENLDLTAEKFDDGKPFYALFCRVNGATEMVDSIWADTIKMIEEAMKEKKDIRDRIESGEKMNFTQNIPKIASDELEKVRSVNYKDMTSIETRCERSKIIFNHLVSAYRKRFPS